MQPIRKFFRRIVTSLPMITIIGVSFLPMKAWGQQGLVLFSLLWFYVFITIEVFGK